MRLHTPPQPRARPGATALVSSLAARLAQSSRHALPARSCLPAPQLLTALQQTLSASAAFHASLSEQFQEALVAGGGLGAAPPTDADAPLAEALGAGAATEQPPAPRGSQLWPAAAAGAAAAGGGVLSGTQATLADERSGVLGLLEQPGAVQQLLRAHAGAVTPNVVLQVGGGGAPGGGARHS